MIRKTKLTVKYRSKDSKLVSAIEEALLPETKTRRRCDLSVSRMKDDVYANSHLLSLNFESGDLVSLRASLNTDLRLVSSALKTVRAVEKTGRS